MLHDFQYFVIAAICMLMMRPVCAEIGPDKITVMDEITVPFAFDAGDINGDGNPDIVTAERITSMNAKDGDSIRVSLYYQKNGGFVRKADKDFELREKGSRVNIKLADVDSEGKNDLLVTGNKTLSVFTAQEQFSRAHTSLAGDQSYTVSSCGKFSIQGKAVFLTGPVLRRWDDEKGEFLPGYGYVGGPEKYDNTEGFLADMDNDGLDDMVFTVTDGGIRIYYSPFFDLKRVLPADTSRFVELATPFPVSRVLIADMNGDTRPDIVAYGGRGILLYFQNSPMDFTDRALPSVVFKNPELVVGTCSCADMDGDGLTDLVVGGRYQNKGSLLVFLQNKDTRFSGRVEEAAQILKTESIYVYGIKCIDINADGKPDLVFSSSANGKTGMINIFRNKK